MDVREERTVEVEGAGVDVLLLAWLDKLTFLFDTGGTGVLSQKLA